MFRERLSLACTDAAIPRGRCPPVHAPVPVRL